MSKTLMVDVAHTLVGAMYGIGEQKDIRDKQAHNVIQLMSSL